MRIKLLLLLFSSAVFSQIPTYYSSIDFTQTGNALKTQLATLITNTHTSPLPYTSSSPDVWDALQAGDVVPGNASRVFLIYGYDDFDAAYKNDRTDDVTNICSGSCPTGSWNREHTYPLSLGTPALSTSSPGPGTDAHHIRASDVTFNSDRGNRLYADGEGDAGPISTFWYPGDEWKGDIARMMMYMYVRYDSRCLANNVGSGANTYHVDMPDIFLEWNEEDPVSTFELNRNNVVQSFQGNRNPFIDNPYLATQIWGGPQAPDSWNTLLCPNSTTWNGSSWNNGTPNKGIRAIINGNFTSSGNLECCSLDISGTAQVTLQTGHTFTVVRAINVTAGANFTVQNNANLIQINNVTNTGNIIYIKESAPIVRLDYTSWSSPVSGQNLLTFSPNTVTNRFYEYITGGTTPTTAYSAIDPTTNNFLPTKGYIIRAPNNWSSSTASSYIGQFTGVPNNGTYETTVSTGFSMLGNPYPASIEGSHFIASNRTIETLYFWTHTVAASGGTYPQNNFASYTTLGGVASAAGGQIPDGSIKPGQGFYFYSGENETITFHNALRFDVKNNQFFRNQHEIITEKDVFRLNLFEDEKPTNQILIGYTENSTLGFDLGIDGKLFDENPSIIYTIIDNKKYTINGRGVFNNEDSFNLGFKANSNSFYKITIENVEGLFKNQAIFLKDNFTGSFINLNKNEYMFLSESGIFENRFEIHYKREELTSNDFTETDFNINSSNNQLQLTSEFNIFSHVVIHDITGRVILDESFSGIHIQFNSIKKSNSILIVNATFKNGVSKTKKIIH